MKNISKIIEDIGTLTPIPQVTQKLMTLLKNPDTDINAITEVILYDPAMTSNILRICNSAYFGLSKQVESLHQAISYLGLNQIIDLVLMKGASENLKKIQKGYDLEEGELWKYSISSALIARELAIKIGQPSDHLIFTATLLKDIGKTVLSRYVSDAYKEINRKIEDYGLTFREAEMSVLGIDHAELGGLVARKWNFSPKMVYIIQNHHLTDKTALNDQETCIVYLADTICMMGGFGVGADGLTYKFDKDVVARLNVSEKVLEDLMVDFVVKINEVEELISMT